jgi:hypothetical protein
VKASLLRWSVAGLLSLFVATSAQSAFAEDDSSAEPAQTTDSKSDKRDGHKSQKKARKKPAAKPKKSSKRSPKTASKKRDKDAHAKGKKKGDKSDKLPALAKGVKQHDDAKPAAQSDKDTGKTTHRNRKKVRRRQAKQQ